MSLFAWGFFDGKFITAITTSILNPFLVGTVTEVVVTQLLD